MPPKGSKIARLENQFTDDRVLRGYLERVLPPDVRTDIRPEMEALSRLAGDELYDLQLADRTSRPELTQ
ncbi:MAG: hypothetical protein GVY25_00050 [Bacteroidetes bacterium]|jgi:hypothetical protein|nr:hypothetical protein [Bacteroidota bacterium]